MSSTCGYCRPTCLPMDLLQCAVIKHAHILSHGLSFLIRTGLTACVDFNYIGKR